MRSRFSAILFLALCLATSVAAQVAARAEPEPKRVLLLYGGRSEFPAIQAVDAGLREAFAARGGVEVFAEFFDFARFPAARHTGGLTVLLRDRYGARKLDMVITTGYEALQFALAQRAELFPGVPITYCHIERHQLAGQTLPPDVTGAVVFHDFRRTIELALKLQPGVREAVCVFGTTELDRQVGQEALAALAKYPELHVRPMNTVPYAEIMEQVRQLPAESMVLYVNMQRDVAGQTRLPPLVAEELSATSSVPVYGIVTHQLERGLMGGAMTDYEAHGREIGALAVARLDGQTPAPRDAAASPLLINWRALKKWHVPESRVPAEAIVRFKPPSLWQEHRGMIIGIVAVVAMQSALIAGLLFSRATRRRAEQALAESTERMDLAADAAQLGSWLWDISNRSVWATEKFREMLGFSSVESITYDGILARVYENDRDAVDSAVQRTLKERVRLDIECRLMLPNGTTRWIAATGRANLTSANVPSQLLGVVIDITERHRVEVEAREVSSKLITAQEDERKRIARDLHDDLNQRLALLSIEMELFGADSKDARGLARDRLVSMTSQVKDLSSEVHRLSYQLHPAKLDQLGLVVAARTFCREVSAQAGTPVHFEQHDVPRDVGADVALCLYRVIQEAVQNSVRHNGGAAIHVSLTNADGRIRLLVSDEGKGFDVNHAMHNGGLGLVSMRERVRQVHGSIQFTSSVGKGARIEATVPLLPQVPAV